jgi:hypothetical protein
VTFCERVYYRRTRSEIDMNMLVAIFLEWRPNVELLQMHIKIVSFTCMMLLQERSGSKLASPPKAE